MTAKAKEIDLEKAAEILGYERISWDGDNDCYSGFGTSNPFDRSRDDVGGMYLASSVDGLRELIRSI